MYIVYTVWTELCGYLTITPTCGSSSNCCHKVFTAHKCPEADYLGLLSNQAATAP